MNDKTKPQAALDRHKPLYEREYLTITEAAKYMNVRVSELKSLIRDQVLVPERAGLRWVLKRADLNRLLGPNAEKVMPFDLNAPPRRKEKDK